MVNPEDLSGGFIPGGKPGQTSRPRDWDKLEKTYNPSPANGGSSESSSTSFPSDGYTRKTKGSAKAKTMPKTSSAMPKGKQKTSTKTKTQAKREREMSKRTKNDAIKDGIRFVGGMGMPPRPRNDDEGPSNGDSKIPYGFVKWQNGPRFPDDSANFKSIDEMPTLPQVKPTEGGEGSYGILGKILSRLQVVDQRLWPQYSGTQRSDFTSCNDDHDVIMNQEYDMVIDAYRSKKNIYAGFYDKINVDTLFIQQSDTLKLLWELAILDNRCAYYVAKDQGMTNTFWNRLAEVLSIALISQIRNDMALALRGQVVKREDHDRIFSLSQTYRSSVHEAGGTDVIVSPRMATLIQRVAEAQDDTDVLSAIDSYAKGIYRLIEYVQFERPIMDTTNTSGDPELTMYRYTGSTAWPIYRITATGDPNTNITKAKRDEINQVLIDATACNPKLDYMKINSIPKGNSESKYSEKFADKWNNMQAYSSIWVPNVIGTPGDSSSTPVVTPASPTGDTNIIYCSDRSPSEQDFHSIEFLLMNIIGSDPKLFRIDPAVLNGTRLLAYYRGRNTALSSNYDMEHTIQADFADFTDSSSRAKHPFTENDYVHKLFVNGSDTFYFSNPDSQSVALYYAITDKIISYQYTQYAYIHEES